MSDKVLWVQNPGSADVSLSDLGMKVPAGKTVNIFKVNPYLTEAQVEASKASGSLSKRLGSKTLRVVEKAVSVNPPSLNQIKQSDQTVQAKKTKSSVVIESDIDLDDEQEAFDFADYGINDLGPDVTRDKQKDGAVVVTAKEDDVTTGEPEESVTTEPGMSAQSQKTMEETQKHMVDPTGPHAKMSRPSVSQPFVVAPPPDQPEETKEPEVSVAQPKPELGATGEILVTTDTEESQKPRSLAAIKESQEEELEEGEAEDDGVELEETRFDSKVATTTEDGAIVMRLKEEEEAE